MSRSNSMVTVYMDTTETNCIMKTEWRITHKQTRNTTHQTFKCNTWKTRTCHIIWYKTWSLLRCFLPKTNGHLALGQALIWMANMFILQDGDSPFERREGQLRTGLCVPSTRNGSLNAIPPHCIPSSLTQELTTTYTMLSQRASRNGKQVWA